MFFPVYCPGAAKIIDEAGVAVNQLGGASVGSVDDGALDAAFDEIVSRFRVQTGSLIQLSRHLQRLFERLRIVESLFDEQAIAVRLEHFDHFELIAVFEHGMGCGPGYDMRGPCDQGIAIPESHGFSIPLRHLLLVLLTNMNLTDEIVRNASQYLHLVRRHHDLDAANGKLRVPPAEP